MKKITKTLTIIIIFLGLALTIQGYTKAAKRNASDVAKLKKIVSRQIKEGATLSTDVKNDSCYTWDKDGNLESIDWSYNNLTGNVNIPVFNKLKTVKISNNRGVTSITIENNTSLEEIKCYGDEDYENNDSIYYPIDMLDIKGCTNLKSLTAYTINKIKTGNSGLDLNSYTNLKEINIHSCNLENIDISHNKKLSRLDIENNKFQEIDLSNNKELKTLILSFNNFSFIDIKNNTKINYLDISFNPCTEIHFTTLNNLNTISCGNTQLKKLDLRDSVKLLSLRCPDGQLDGNGLLLGKNTELTYIDCHNNKDLTSIGLSGCVSLTRLNCGNCSLNSLNLDKTTKLARLYCKNNKLKELNTSSLPKLKTLNCSNNQLTSLDLSNNKNLSKLICKGNNITELDLSNCSKLLETDKGSFTYDTQTAIIQ